MDKTKYKTSHVLLKHQPKTRVWQPGLQIKANYPKEWIL